MVASPSTHPERVQALQVARTADPPCTQQPTSNMPKALPETLASLLAPLFLGGSFILALLARLFLHGLLLLLW